MSKRILATIMLVLVLIAVFSGCGTVKKATEGDKSFTLTVIDAEGNEKSFDIVSDRQYLGDALTDEGLIKGEEGAYGLYIKEVDGVTADYDTDGTYWAFYIDGDYAMSGVDTTEIVDGASYSLEIAS